MLILSIDPGYERLGIAVIEKNPSDKRERLLYSDCFKTDKKLPFPERLVMIGQEIGRLLTKYRPEALAIETLFFNTNQTTAMKVSEARGVVIFQCAQAGLTISEFTPLEIKIAISGYGRGDKKQITAMVEKLIEISEPIKHDDEYDAIAVGLTFFATAGTRNFLRKK